MIHQTRLPSEYTEVEIHRSEDMVQAITTMIVRDAPAIVVAAAYEMYLGARLIEKIDNQVFLRNFKMWLVCYVLPFLLR